MKPVAIRSPLDDETISRLKSGDWVLITGIIYVARDAAHMKMIEALDRNEPLPFDVRGQTIYYMGPAPAKPGQPIGSAGPTTSGRMDSFTPRLLVEGLKVMIGKGKRTQVVKDAMIKHRAVYLAAVGGAGALISRSIRKSEIIAYADLGPGAVLRLEVEDFPAIVVNDIYGGDLYQEGQAKYRMELK
ncbi:MAG: Fe-S-containing hydro-lyase [Chloroflexi bacterium]|nr:Fe-S-containing hydro-lyase [Chloroflexota bacterium]